MAGRKDKNTVDYFPHYCIPGKTLFILESKYKHLGYSIWFKTLELLGSTENHYIDLRNETDLLFLISKLKTTEFELIEIYNLLSKLGAIDSFFWSKKIIYSENFIENIKDAYKRRVNLCMHKCDLCKHLKFKCSLNDDKCGQKTTKKSKEKKSKKESSLHLSNLNKSTWQLWIDYKKSQFGFSYKRLESEQIALNDLIRLSNDKNSLALSVINQSISNGWKGLFELKSNGQSSNKKLAGS